MRKRFGKLVADAARKTGKYDIDGRGGKAQLARDTGMAESAVGRMLKGESLPDPRFFEPIAQAVEMDVRDLLIEAKIAKRESLSVPVETGAAGVGSRSITTPGDAADALGIFDPIAREMFLGTVERLKRMQRPPTDEAGSDGSEAAQM